MSSPSLAVGVRYGENSFSKLWTTPPPVGVTRPPEDRPVIEAYRLSPTEELIPSAGEVGRCGRWWRCRRFGAWLRATEGAEVVEEVAAGPRAPAEVGSRVRLRAHVRGQRGAGGARRRFAKLSRCRRLIGLGWSAWVPVAAVRLRWRRPHWFGGPAQGRRRAKACGGGRCAPRLPRAERDGPPLRRQGPQNIFALRVRCAEDLLLPPLPAEPLRPIGTAPRRGQERASPIRRPREQR